MKNKVYTIYYKTSDTVYCPISEVTAWNLEGFLKLIELTKQYNYKIIDIVIDN